MSEPSSPTHCLPRTPRPCPDRIGIGEVLLDQCEIAFGQAAKEAGQLADVLCIAREDIHVVPPLRCLRKSMMVGRVVLAAVLPTKRPTCPASSRSSCLSL